VTYWVPSIAPCGASFYTGKLFPEWITSWATHLSHRFQARSSPARVRRHEQWFSIPEKLTGIKTRPARAIDGTNRSPVCSMPFFAVTIGNRAAVVVHAISDNGPPVVPTGANPVHLVTATRTVLVS